MLNLEDITIEQLRSATKDQIVNFVTNKLNNMSKRQIILWLWDEVSEIADEPIRTYRKDGQIESQVEANRDIESGELINGRRIDWTYYSTGEVDTITIRELDGLGVEAKKKIIKHYKDGRQPEVTNDQMA